MLTDNLYKFSQQRPAPQTNMLGDHSSPLQDVLVGPTGQMTSLTQDERVEGRSCGCRGGQIEVPMTGPTGETVRGVKDALIGTVGPSGDVPAVGQVCVYLGHLADEGTKGRLPLDLSKVVEDPGAGCLTDQHRF